MHTISFGTAAVYERMAPNLPLEAWSLMKLAVQQSDGRKHQPMVIQ
jgi:hypothetical protein